MIHKFNYQAAKLGIVIKSIWVMLSSNLLAIWLHWLFTVSYFKWFSILWRLSYSFFLESWLVLGAEVTFWGFWGCAKRSLAASAQASWNTYSWNPGAPWKKPTTPSPQHNEKTHAGLWRGHTSCKIPYQAPDIQVIPAVVLDILEQSRADSVMCCLVSWPQKAWDKCNNSVGTVF